VQQFSVGDIQCYFKSELRMANFCRLQTGMYAERLIGRIDRDAMFCSLFNVIEVLFSCSNYYELC
jgi:hypothetical protein